MHTLAKVFVLREEFSEDVWTASREVSLRSLESIPLSYVVSPSCETRTLPTSLSVFYPIYNTVRRMQFCAPSNVQAILTESAYNIDQVLF